MNSTLRTQKEGSTERREVKSHETYHPLYVIYSKWSFKDLYGLLEMYTNNPREDIGSLKVDYDSEGYDTNRTFVLLSSNVVDGLRKDGYDRPNPRGFSFARYKVKDTPVPSRSLCIPLPKNLNMNGSDVSSLIKGKLDEALQFGILGSEDFTVTVPLSSREADLPKGAAYIGFKESVDNETISVVRALLHNTLWNYEVEDENKLVFICHYARTNPRRNDNKGRPDGQKEKKPFFKHEQKYEMKNEVKGKETSS